MGAYENPRYIRDLTAQAYGTAITDFGKAIGGGILSYAASKKANEDAIENYSKALEFNPKHIEAQKNLIHILTYYTPTKKNLNSIIVANNGLRKLGNNFSFKDNIKKNYLTTLFKNSNKIIQENILIQIKQLINFSILILV
jgi:hypothetical protein